MTSSVLQSVGVAVGWRSHSVLEDEPDSPLPDRFRKRPSSSSLNTLRMSLRKRLPLRSVTLNVQENPTWEALESRQKPGAVRSLTRSARSTLGNVSQRIQKSCVPREDCLVQTPGKPPAGEKQKSQAARTPRKNSTRLPAASPKYNPKHTPKSGSKRPPRAARTPEAGGSLRAGKGWSGRRKLVRMAALRSPFASPSRSDQAVENYKQLMVESYESSQHKGTRRASIRNNTARIRDTVHSWKDAALSNIRKGN
ncbi:Protein FAM64A [Acipenser ruthenus]|uniref:Protein FAM64A n=1 Tax=Acipenser ruthenus TaxID=7906 RepID=A0A444UU97_ACIRT|nr:Protein FAM64A [Acipenser ruthenus]